MEKLPTLVNNDFVALDSQMLYSLCEEELARPPVYAVFH